MRDNGYDTTKRILIALAAIVGWVVSFHFSVKGFNVQVPDDKWAAYGLVIMFTGLELAFSRTRLKLAATLILGAFVAYGYGIWTNVLGIYVMMHPSAITLAGATWDQLILPLSAGTGLEVVPEALLVYAIFPETAAEVSDSMHNFGEVFSDLFRRIGARWDNAVNPPRRTRPTAQPQPRPAYQPQHRPTWKQAPTVGGHQVGGSYRPSVSSMTGMGMMEDMEGEDNGQ